MKTSEMNLNDLGKKRANKQIGDALWPPLEPPFKIAYFLKQAGGKNFASKTVRAKYIYEVLRVGFWIENALHKVKTNGQVDQGRLLRAIVLPENPSKNTWRITLDILHRKLSDHLNACVLASQTLDLQVPPAK